MMVLQGTRTIARITAATGLVAVALLPISAAHGQTPRYSVRNLGPLLQNAETDYPDAVSGDGTKVVGQAVVASGGQQVWHAFYWDGTMHDIGVRNMAPRG